MEDRIMYGDVPFWDSMESYEDENMILEERIEQIEKGLTSLENNQEDLKKNQKELKENLRDLRDNHLNTVFNIVMDNMRRISYLQGFHYFLIALTIAIFTVILIR